MLPRGASPIDFAYAIHTEVGHQCVGARVNGKMVPLRYKLKNGDIVEILTSPGHKPSRDWLGFTVTNKAKAKVRHYLNTTEKQQALEIGRKHLERELRRYDLSLKKVVAEPSPLESLAQELGRRHARSTTSSPPSATARSRCARCSRGSCRRRSSQSRAPEKPRARRRRGQALPAARRRADHGEGHRRPPRLPGQVLQPDHGRAHRRLHHARQGRLRPLGRTAPTSRTSSTTPSGASRSSGRRGPRAATRCASRSGSQDRPGALAAVTAALAALKTDVRDAQVRTFDDRTASIELTVRINDLKHLDKVLKSVRGVTGRDRRGPPGRAPLSGRRDLRAAAHTG